MTRAGFAYILAKHAVAAARKQPPLAAKRVTPHVLRHSCAMHMLQATRDIRRVSLWLGHASLQSTEIYLRADPTEKLEALTALAPPSLRRGRFRPPDTLIALLQESR
jgi:integrase/recombinase XerD